jgi:hypothetical protein
VPAGSEDECDSLGGDQGACSGALAGPDPALPHGNVDGLAS